MKRTRILAVALVLFVLALAFTATSNTRTAKAQDPCVTCQGKVQALYEACADLYGETAYCGDIFNDGIVFCYATVCEQ
ncbi:MAG TPA: hypothetical protein VFS10_01200 [Pyrinomonadaceae bacterium]|nr:hypothetical protein [Pyrinomonadaceae bacterium]